MTNGTFDYLKRIQEKHPQEHSLLLMRNADSALLLHETNSSTIFKEPRRFEVIISKGELRTDDGFIVMNHIPTTDEGRPLLEHRFKSRDQLVEQQHGFVAIRMLRPLKNNTYVILTMWEDEQSFRLWQQSTAFQKAHKQKETDKNTSVHSDIFAGPTYIATYVIQIDEAEEN